LFQIEARGGRITFTPENIGTTLEKFQPIENELRDMEQAGLITLGRHKPESQSAKRLFYRVPATITEYGKRYLRENG
jgi:hypothetical protein